MKRYLARRLLLLVPVLAGVSVIIFMVLHLSPGDPVEIMLGSQATQEDRARLRADLGLDQPLHVQYVRWLGHVARGDLGRSLWMKRPVLAEVLGRFQATLILTGTALGLSTVAGLALGVASATRPNSLLDRVSAMASLFGASMPSFWLGIVLIYIFSIQLGWLPSARMGGPSHYILPTITLGAFLVAGMMRLVRSSVLEVLDSEFVKLARIKGLSQTVVIWKHCLRNALIPVVTLFGVFFALLVTGAIVTETVFAWPGVGRLTYEAVIFRDYPLLQAVILMKAIIVLGVNLCVDILYAYLDPRVRYA